MFLTVHAASAIIIGQSTDNIFVAFFGGILAHFFLDTIPHGDQDLIEEKFKFSQREVTLLRNIGTVDTIVMLTMLGILYWLGLVPFTWPVAASLVGALLPDFLNAVYVFTRTQWLKAYFSFQHDIHYLLNGFTVRLKTGLIIQTIFLIGLLSWIFHLK